MHPYLLLFAIVGGVAIFGTLFAVLRRRADRAHRLRLADDRNAERGEEGEWLVARVLGGTIEGEQYLVNDLLFTDARGNSHQIDHVLLNRNGIWVIETKNYAGAIFGKADDRNWTQVLNRDTKNKFYNPCKQNATHVYSLVHALGLRQWVQSVVVFTERADISHVDAENVCTLDELPALVRSETGSTLSAREMRALYERLLALGKSAAVSHEEHVRRIRADRDAIERGVCPRCGGKLVIRKGEHGVFLGCSNYPACTFHKPLDRN